MKIRRFTAPDIEAALRMARHALGPDAVILETRGAVSSPGGVGVTVVAAVDRSRASGSAAADAGPGRDPFLGRRERLQPFGLAGTELPRPRISVAVTSGKGGVGKTSLAANLAIQFAAAGRRVLLIDGDFGLANVDLLLGLTPVHTLDDVVRGRKRVEEVLLTGPAGIQVLPAASGESDLVDLDDYRRELLMRALENAARGRDVLLIDTGSGIHRQTLRLAQMAREILVVTTPEPPAFSDAYATIKTLAMRQLRQPPRLIINRVRDNEEAHRVAEKIRRLTRRFLGLSPELYGFIPEDEAVPTAIRMQQPFLTAFPQAQVSVAVRAIAKRILAANESPKPDAARSPQSSEETAA